MCVWRIEKEGQLTVLLTQGNFLKNGDIETRLMCLKIDYWAKGTDMQNHTDMKRGIVCYRNGEDQNVDRTLGNYQGGAACSFSEFDRRKCNQDLLDWNEIR